MRANIIALSALLIGSGLLATAGAEAAFSGNPGATTTAAAATQQPAGAAIQLAFGNGLGEKYMAGKSGGRYGVGGTEPRGSAQAKKPQVDKPRSTAQGTKPPQPQQ